MSASFLAACVVSLLILTSFKPISSKIFIVRWMRASAISKLLYLSKGKTTQIKEADVIKYYQNINHVWLFFLLYTQNFSAFNIFSA